jgi:hephaestin
MSGMEALYDVVEPAQPPAQITGGATRKFFMAAEKVEWDYAPQGYQKGCTVEDQSANAQFTLTAASDRIGSK